MRVLFVDDQRSVLDALLRALRHDAPPEWELEVAHGGLEALEALAAIRFDVVVTDVEMPGMNGVELLSRVRLQHPHVVRIVLTGEPDGEPTQQALPIAHYSLAKPCSLELLRSAIVDSEALRALIRDRALLDLAGKIGALPSLPRVCREILAAVDGDTLSLHEIAAIVEGDPALAAKILQLSQSAFFGGRPIASVYGAVARLGTKNLRSLVLVSGILAMANGERAGPVDVSWVQKHATRAAEIAREIARGTPEEHAAFTAALLHLTGILMLVTHRTRELQELIDRAGGWDEPTVRELERHTWGAADTELGAYLLGLWRLPKEIVEAVAHCAEPRRCPASSPSRVLAITHLAVCAERGLEPDAAWLEQHGLAEWRERAATRAA